MYSTSLYLYDIGNTAIFLIGNCEGEIPDETLDGSEGDEFDRLEAGENGD